jgi:sulfur carrier protein ThiS
MEEGSTVGTLIKLLDLPLKLNVIAIVEGKRVSMDEPVRDGSSIRIVSLTLGG